MKPGLFGTMVPSSWSLRSLGELVQEGSDSAIPCETPTLPYIGMEHIESGTGRVIALASPSDYRSSSYVAKPNQVLYGRLRPYLNKVFIPDREVYASREFIPLTPGESLNSNYLLYLLRSSEFVNYAMSLNSGDRPRVKWQQMESCLIPAPPLDEQDEIVRILEEQFSRLDAAAASIAAIRRKAEQFRRSILHAAFSGALTNQDSSTSGLPVGWCKKTIGEVASVVAGRTPTKFEQRLEESPAANRVVPFYKVGDMNSSAQYLREARVYFAEAEAKAFGLEILPAETIIFPKAGGAIATNKKRVLEVPGAIDLNCMGVTAKTEFQSKLLFWFFESFNLSSLADGSVLPQIGKKRVSAVEVCFPVSDVHQRDLLNKIESGVSKCDGVLQVASELERRMSSLKRSLLRSAFAGELTKEWREKNHG